MKIFGLDIKFAQTVNKDVQKPVEADIFNKYVDVPLQIYRASKDIGNFKNAVIAAENYLNPQRYELYQIYTNISLDAHLSAAVQQRKFLLMGKEFEVIGANGDVDEKKTALIRKKWFRDYLSLALDSEYWGHSLIQFGSIKDDEYTSVELVPRQFVKPELSIVTKTWGDIQGRNYTDEPWASWCLSVGEKKNLGLYMKAAPLIIWKQAALGAWAEYQEVFGTPVRIGKTNVRDQQTRQNMIEMLMNMASSTWGVFDKDDELQLQDVARSGSSQIFNDMIDRVNREISKLILGQTMTMDDGSSLSQAEVHERILERISEADGHFITSVNNYQLVPMMIKHGLLSIGDKIRIAESEELSVMEKAKLALEFIKTGKYKMSVENIEEEYDIELEEINEDKGLDRFKNSIEDLYS